MVRVEGFGGCWRATPAPGGRSAQSHAAHSRVRGEHFVEVWAMVTIGRFSRWLMVVAVLLGLLAVDAGAVLRIPPPSGTTPKLADLAAFERANNPDTFEITSDPYGLLLASDGSLYVADAGANDLVRLNVQTGQMNLVTVFAGIPA